MINIFVSLQQEIDTIEIEIEICKPKTKLGSMPRKLIYIPLHIDVPHMKESFTSGMWKTDWYLIYPKESTLYLQFIIECWLIYNQGFQSRIIQVCNSQDWGGGLTGVSSYHLLSPGKTPVSRISVSSVVSDVANLHLLCENLIRSKTPVMSTLHLQTTLKYLHVLEVGELKKWTSKLKRIAVKSNQMRDSDHVGNLLSK